MRKFCLALGTAIAMSAFVIGSASAAPMSRAATGEAPAVESQVLKVHGWHRWCEWGPVRYHRHVPGVGNVPCERGGGWGGGGGGDGDHCRHTRHKCGERYGWGNWEFRHCMRRKGC